MSDICIACAGMSALGFYAKANGMNCGLDSTPEENNRKHHGLSERGNLFSTLGTKYSVAITGLFGSMRLSNIGRQRSKEVHLFAGKEVFGLQDQTSM